MTNFKELFMLDPNVIFFNHGSFGACPQAVFTAYQSWQRRFELQPVKFMRELAGFDLQARQALGAYLNTDPANLAFITNATTGVNIIARSLNLQPGDEILTTDQEYGACNNTWNYLCEKTGARYIHRPIPLPADSPEEIVTQFLQGVTERTRVIYLSHITSPTAWIIPIAEICAWARLHGILTVIDGAHAPGQLALDLEAIGADFYTGNCHKWMLSPKGSGFLYARPDQQYLLQPLVVSWAYNAEKIKTGEQKPMDFIIWNGTRDPSPFLASTAAIEFMAEHDWPGVRQECHALLRQAVERICAWSGQTPFYPLESSLYSQMAIAPLPVDADTATLHDRLYDGYHIEVPVFPWNGHKVLRLSIQAYNTQQEVDILIDALGKLC